MRITHIITTLVFGGAEKLLSNLTKFHAQDHEIEIIYFKENPKLLSELHPAVKVTKIQLGWCVFSQLIRHLKRTKPDIVHTHLGHADFIGLLASKFIRCKRICTMHNISFKWDYRDKLVFIGYRVLFRYIVPNCKVISISKSVRSHVIETLRVKASNSRLLYNGIPELRKEYAKEEERLELGIHPDEFVILFIGRLRIQKSLETLIRAMKELEDILNLSMIVVGDGELRGQLERLCESLEVDDKITFVGTTQVPEKYFAASDLFVLPSVFEGLGLVILEAFRAGLPVIASRIEGPSELVEHNHNGLLFEPGNYEELSYLIRKVYENQSLRKKISKNGLLAFDQKFKIENYANELEKIYYE